MVVEAVATALALDPVRRGTFENGYDIQYTDQHGNTVTLGLVPNEESDYYLELHIRRESLATLDISLRSGDVQMQTMAGDVDVLVNSAEQLISLVNNPQPADPVEQMMKQIILQLGYKATAEV